MHSINLKEWCFQQFVKGTWTILGEALVIGTLGSVTPGSQCHCACQGADNSLLHSIRVAYYITSVL